MPTVAADIDAAIRYARRFGSPATKALYAACDGIDAQPDGGALVLIWKRAARPAAPADLRGLLHRDCPASFHRGLI